MQSIRIHDKIFVPYLTREEIETGVKDLAAKLDADYKAERPLFISILNGSFMFAAELFKSLTMPSEICFIKLASYKGTTSAGHVITSIGLDAEIKGRHVIILEDIIDTGTTLSQFLPQLHHQNPSSLRIACLLHKTDATLHDVQPDYCCFSIPNKFVVGYGLDYDGLGRNIPAVYQLQE